MIVAVIGTVIYFAGSMGWLVPGPVKRVRGEAVEDIKKRAEAGEALLSENIESGQKVGSDFSRLGMEYLKRREWTPAVDAFVKAIGYGQNQAGIHHSTAVAYANRGKETSNPEDIKKAEEHYNQAIAKNPKMWDSHYGLAVLKYFVKNEKTEALEIVRRIKNREPSYIPARFAAARFIYEGGDPTGALAEYEELYAYLNGRSDSAENREYKKLCKDNITKILSESAR